MYPHVLVTNVVATLTSQYFCFATLQQREGWANKCNLFDKTRPEPPSTASRSLAFQLLHFSSQTIFDRAQTFRPFNTHFNSQLLRGTLWWSQLVWWGSWMPANDVTRALPACKTVAWQILFNSLGWTLECGWWWPVKCEEQTMTILAFLNLIDHSLRSGPQIRRWGGETDTRLTDATW